MSSGLKGVTPQNALNKVNTLTTQKPQAKPATTAGTKPTTTPVTKPTTAGTTKPATKPTTTVNNPAQKAPAAKPTSPAKNTTKDNKAPQSPGKTAPAAKPQTSPGKTTAQVGKPTTSPPKTTGNLVASPKKGDKKDLTVKTPTIGKTQAPTQTNIGKKPVTNPVTTPLTNNLPKQMTITTPTANTLGKKDDPLRKSITTPTAGVTNPNRLSMTGKKEAPKVPQMQPQKTPATPANINKQKTQVVVPNIAQPQKKISGQKGKENTNMANQVPKLTVDTTPIQMPQTEKYDLSEIPDHMREDIRDLIERKVEERVMHEMEYLRAEAHGALEFQRRGSLANSSAYKTNWSRIYDGQYPWNSGYYQGHYNHYNGAYGGAGYPYHPYSYYGGFGYYGQPYGQTGYVPKNEEDEYLYNIATSAKMRTRSPIVGKRTQMLNYTTDKTVEFQIESPQGPKSKEYVVQRVTKGEEALSRRKAYDAHLKTDIMLSGRDKSMNKTYDPYYHPYWAAPPVNHPNQAYAYGPYKPTQQSTLQSDAYETPAEGSPPRNQRR